MRGQSPDRRGYSDQVYFVNQTSPLVPFSRTSLRTGETVRLPPMRREGKHAWAVNLADRCVAAFGPAGEVEVYDLARNRWSNALLPVDAQNPCGILLVNGRLLTVTYRPDISGRMYYDMSKIRCCTTDILDPESGWSNPLLLVDPDRDVDIRWSDGKPHKRWRNWGGDYVCYEVMQNSNKDVRTNVVKQQWRRKDVMGYVTTRIETVPILRLTKERHNVVS